ncbi:TonB-dependent siderophore receptor [Methylocapsa aurea]|uniref:TonB-dependent siderophore receptor n=1 Tax=Methylocapsa aurea TaxID=663610 RepID=UPI003D189981
MSSTVAAAALGALTIGTGQPAPAQAALPPDAPITVSCDYSISPGSLGSALNRFADKSGLHLLYDARVTRRISSPGLRGSYSVKEGLDRLLSGTNLSYRFSADGETVSIRLAQADNGVRSDAGAEPLPPIEIGAPLPPANGPSNGKPVLTPQNSYVTPVVSTGTKTDTPVMNTPVNVQAITEKRLEDQQAINLTEALRDVSGVYTVSSSVTNTRTPNSAIFLRGFQTSNIYVDGFRIDGGGGTNSMVDPTGSQQLGNVSSVEVLKGPAAILYGLSEPGGIVNITTKNPLETPHYAITQQVGSLAQYRTTLNATGPLADDKSVLYRMDLSYLNDGAPTGSQVDHNRASSVFIAPVVKWNISESTWVKAEVQYNDLHTGLLRSNTIAWSGIFVDIPRNLNYYGNSAVHEPTILAALTFSHKFNEDWSIKSRIAYSGIDFNANMNEPGSISIVGIPTLTRSNSQITGLQRSYSTNHDLVGHFDLLGAKHTLLLGGDFYKTILGADSYSPPVTTFVSLNFPVEPGLPTTQSNSFLRFYSVQETAGAYIQDQIELPYGLFAMAGARYQNISQRGVTTVHFPGLLDSYTNAPLDSDRLTPRFGLAWRPEPWITLYGNYTEGFASNGINYIYPSTLAPPSDARSWEIGAKFEAFDGRLRATVDYFDLKKTNTPIPDTDTTHRCGIGSCVLVAGEVESKGVELDIQGELLPGWNVILNYTNEDVRVIQGTVFGFATQTAGSRLPYRPRNLGRLGTTYEFQDAHLKGLKVGATYTYYGSSVLQTATGLQGIVPPLLAAYGTVDLMSAYTFTVNGLKTTAQLNATNIFDKTYYTDADQNNTPAKGFSTNYRRTYGPPFAVRGSLRVEF